AETLSLGISTLMESEGSSTFVFMPVCQIVCPSRERNQLTKTRPALGLDALLTKPSHLFPLFLFSYLPSLRLGWENSSTGNPCCFGRSVAPQSMQVGNLPEASQSLDWRRSSDTVRSISVKRRRRKSGPSCEL